MSNDRADDRWINVNSGTRFHPFDPRPEEILIADIAHALGRACRYAGHTQAHYSVAQHSVIVAEAVKILGGTLDEQRWALMHDATEAYLVDIPNPIKRHPSFAFYVELEDKLAASIMAKFGLPPNMPGVVKYADQAALRLEVASPLICKNMHPDFRWSLPVFGENIDAKLEPLLVKYTLSPEKATALFMDKFRELFAGTEHAPAAKRGVLIGVGYRKRSGKDTLAGFLEQDHPNFRRISFAGLLKEGVNIWHGWDDRHSDELKEVVDPKWGYTPRHAYQKIGTECIRDRFANNFWVDAAFNLINKWRDQGINVVITDVRFPNEADVVREEGGALWFVNRPSLPPLTEDDHISERALVGYTPDATVENDSTLEAFRVKVQTLFYDMVMNKQA